MTPLWEVRVTVDPGDGGPAMLYEVRSALTPAPMPGDVIPYGDDLELVVLNRYIGVGQYGGRPPVVVCKLARGSIEALERVRFRRRTGGRAPAPA